jgi:SAM-dependent methyltransferase
MGLQQVRDKWSKLGESDAMWAVLTERGKSGNRWDQDEFLATGRAEIATQLAELDRHNLPVKFDRALDFGCGVGRLTQGLVAGGFAQATGIDISPGMIKKAEEVNACGDRCTFVLNEVADLSVFENDSFDLVYTRRVLQHMPSDVAMSYVREFFRVGRPGGIVVFQIPTVLRRDLPGLVMRSVPKPVLNRLRRGMEMHGTPVKEVVSVIGSAGGSVVAMEVDDAAGKRWLSKRYICRVL